MQVGRLLDHKHPSRLLVPLQPCTTRASSYPVSYEQSILCSGNEPDLHQLACCADRISRHTNEARNTRMVQAAQRLVEKAAGSSALEKRLGLCVLGVDVDLWVSNWSNLYQLEGMQIGTAKPYMFLGHSIGPQLGTAAVILQPDKTCYHVDWSFQQGSLRSSSGISTGLACCRGVPSCDAMQCTGTAYQRRTL